MIKWTFVLWGCLVLQAALARTEVLFKGDALRNAGYSVYVLDANDGRVIYQTPQLSLVPASVMKALTTAAALEILGADFKFHTQMGIAGKINNQTGSLEGNLVIRGGCDPAFYSEYFVEHYQGTFESWADILKNAGIKAIAGDLIADLSSLESISIPGGWQWDDIGNYYGAGVSALTYADNSYKIHLSSPAESGKPAEINHLEPEIDSLKLINKVFSSEINRDRTVIFGAPGSFSQSIEGTIPKGRADFVVKGAMPDPAAITAAEFIKVLKFKNINFNGKILFVNQWAGEDYTLMAEKSSPPLQDLIVPLNHESLNLYAEHLLREIGRATNGNPALENSADALKNFWMEQKIYSEGFYPADGSGLSRANAVCSRTLAEVLYYMYHGSNRDVYFNSFPVAGLNGTLQNSFKGTRLENNLQAKTGSMTRVKSLAGIFTNQDGQKIIFALISNNFEGTQSAVGGLIESFLMEIYELKSQISKR
jgi:D-alanyl-D-alanine carboxypeptidase/D-alanyl-D-alanine-endopeptidase (penicillin-binding protein 4)